MPKSPPTPTLHDEVTAALKRLQTKDRGLKRLLKSAYGYAVFPSVGKAFAVVGGAYGRGEVYEKGKLIGYATISQLTLGVQLGGDTFSEIIVFESKRALVRFKRGKTAFTANASAVLVKAGAAGTADYEKGVKALAYARGGMLLELSIGGQKFNFKPVDGKGQGESEQEDEEQDEQSGQRESGTGLAPRAIGGIRSAASSVGSLAKEHPVAATVIGVGVAAGVGLLVVRTLLGGASSAGQDEGREDDQDEDRDEEDDEEGDAEASDRDEEGEEESEDDGGEEDEEEGGDDEQGSGGVLRRLLSRGRSRA
jgi:hypothetical protein